MLEGMNRAIEHIEQNLDGDMDYGEIAKIAGCSPYHFQRMFAAITDIPLSEYIRRRGLTLAAFELQNSGRKIIDIALEFGYQSPDAFTRAFQGMHGIAPSKAREKGVSLKAYARITFTLSIKGVIAMNYRIEEKPAFTAVGIKKWVNKENNEQLSTIPAMWNSMAEEKFETLMSLSDGEPTGVFGMCAEMYDGGFDYWIAASSNKPVPAGMESLRVNAGTWAIFESVGPMPGAIQKVWGRIFSEWFPTSGYEHAQSPEIEWYSDGDPGAEDYKSEVWIPVIKK